MIEYNLYQFLGNQPIGKIDLFGLMTLLPPSAVYIPPENLPVIDYQAGKKAIQIAHEEILSNLNSVPVFSGATGLNRAVAKIFNIALPLAYIQIGYGEGSYDRWANTMRLDPWASSAVVLHEMVHRYFDVNRWLKPGWGLRDEEGIAYLLEDYYEAIPLWHTGIRHVINRMSDNIGDCVSNHEDLKRGWMRFWESYGQLSKLDGKNGLGGFINLKFTEADVNRTYYFLNAKLDCGKLARELNRLEVIKNCCFTFSCQNTQTSGSNGGEIVIQPGVEIDGCFQ